MCFGSCPPRTHLFQQKRLVGRVPRVQPPPHVRPHAQLAEEPGVWRRVGAGAAQDDQRLVRLQLLGLHDQRRHDRRAARRACGDGPSGQSSGLVRGMVQAGSVRAAGAEAAAQRPGATAAGVAHPGRKRDRPCAPAWQWTSTRAPFCRSAASSQAMAGGSFSSRFADSSSSRSTAMCSRPAGGVTL